MINVLKKAYAQYALKIFFTLLASTVIYSCSKSDDEIRCSLRSDTPIAVAKAMMFAVAKAMVIAVG